MYVLRNGANPNLFLNDSAKYGPLEEAYPYQTREQAESEVYPGDDVVEVTMSIKPPEMLFPASMPDNLGPLVKLALLRVTEHVSSLRIMPYTPGEWAMVHMNHATLVDFAQKLLSENHPYR